MSKNKILLLALCLNSSSFCSGFENKPDAVIASNTFEGKIQQCIIPSDEEFENLAQYHWRKASRTAMTATAYDKLVFLAGYVGILEKSLERISEENLPYLYKNTCKTIHGGFVVLKEMYPPEHAAQLDPKIAIYKKKSAEPIDHSQELIALFNME